jgi:hypothetical protein
VVVDYKHAAEKIAAPFVTLQAVSPPVMSHFEILKQNFKKRSYSERNALFLSFCAQRAQKERNRAFRSIPGKNLQSCLLTHLTRFGH